MLTRSEIEEFIKGLRDKVVEDHPTLPGTFPRPLRLPNLKVTNCEARVVGNSIHINADVMNCGIAKAGKFDVAGMVSIYDTTGAADPPVQLPSQNVKGLVPGERIRFRPFAEIENPGDGYFVNVEICADPPTEDSPGGEIWESDETDNCCRTGVFTTIQTPEDEPNIPNPPGIPR